MIDYAISVSTYIMKEKVSVRLPIFKKCIDSLCATSFEGTIYIVDDGSEINDHIDWIEQKKDSRIRLIKNNENLGIAKTKNIGLKTMFDNQNINYVFLSDDDVIFKKPNWYTKYIECSKQTNISHFSYALPYDARKQAITQFVKNTEVSRLDRVNGCFLFVSRELFDKIGYFKVFPYKYGHEHSNYSLRARTICGEFYDLVDSYEYLELIPESNGNSSINIDEDRMRKNEFLLWDNIIYRNYE